jgi:pyruvate dehydrogenase E1 component
MIFDGFTQQLPDIDPAETDEWLASLDAVVESHGRPRARFLLSKLLERAREQQVSFPATVSTPYVNSIPRENEPWFPGDEHLERRIRAYARWNAAAMVNNANKHADGIGGHLSTYASSASLYEIGFNHFFRGKEDGQPGDHVYYQGHAAPGIYARAFLEGRLSEDDLNHFRREIGRVGLSSYPHPRLMPEFWEYPTVSMGLGPINAIYQARFNRYLHNRRIDDTSASRVWCFMGDGECDEPESLGALSLGARERLDNLVFVVNCNLQRLDGPVRGNGKVIQELEAVFRGAGWNVIKVIWGSKWDDLLARDTDGVLLNKMNSTVDGEFQRYAIEDGNYAREHFFGPDPRLRKMAEHLTDDDIRMLPRGGHDYRKLYAAYKGAVDNLGSGAPTAILCKTVKGWTLGPEFEGRNSTHQIKKMTPDQMKRLRDRLYLQDEIPEAMLETGAGDMPYFRPTEDSPEMQYLRSRRAALAGSIPVRKTALRRPVGVPADGAYTDVLGGSGKQAVSTTMAFTRLLRNLTRDETVGQRIVPIIPDEARTFGMDSLFREIGIYASQGQKYEPVDHDLLLSYSEKSDGQILEEGITEAGSMSSWIAAGTSYATRGVPMIPFYTFYSMFGFQRVGDLIWLADDARARGFLMGATAGRTTLMGEGLQHQDGHSLVLASTVPHCQAYDPAFAYEMALIVQHGIERMYGGTSPDPDVFYYIAIYNENQIMPAAPELPGLSEQVLQGLYRWREAPEGPSKRATIIFSGSANVAAQEAAAILADRFDVACELWSATSYKLLRDDALAAERWNRLHPGGAERMPLVTRLLNETSGPIIAVTDFMKIVPEQVARFAPDDRPFMPLGTDGMGRSDTREALRRHFEVDAAHIVVATLSMLAEMGEVKTDTVADAIRAFDIDVDGINPALA